MYVQKISNLLSFLYIVSSKLNPLFCRCISLVTDPLNLFSIKSLPRNPPNKLFLCCNRIILKISLLIDIFRSLS